MIVGIDEVGRGAWAGPLCVAAVGLGGITIDGLTDSKKLTKKKRERLALEIKQAAPLVGIGWVSARDIDQIGMSAALKLAATRALSQCDVMQIDQVIIDGTIRLVEPSSHYQVSTMKQADLLVPSVSAASIVAKVARDHYMQACDQVFSGYNFSSHVGYGTAMHHECIKQCGTVPIHRMSFAPMNTLAPTTAKSADSPRAIGDRAESAAAQYLQSLRYEIIDRNWKTKWCEIDIIARKNAVLYFVEVKYRRSARQGGGIAAVTPVKLRQMKFAAELWLQKFGTADARLSVIEVSGDDFDVTHFIESVAL